MSETRISVRANSDDKTKWEKAAQQQDLNFADFVREGLDIISSFDPWFWRNLKNQARSLGVEPGLLIQNFYCHYKGIEDAEKTMEPGLRGGALPYLYFELEETVNDEGFPITIRIPPDVKMIHRKAMDDEMARLKRVKEKAAQEEEMWRRQIEALEKSQKGE